MRKPSGGSEGFVFPNRIIYRTDFIFEICFKNTYYGLVSYPSVFNVFWLEEPSGDSEGFFMLNYILVIFSFL